MARRESEIQTARSIFSRQSGPLRSGRGGGGGVIQCCNPQWGLTHAHIAPMLQQSVIRWIGPPLLFLLEVINDFLWHAANSPSTVEALFLLAPPPLLLLPPPPPPRPSSNQCPSFGRHGFNATRGPSRRVLNALRGWFPPLKADGNPAATRSTANGRNASPPKIHTQPSQLVSGVDSDASLA